MTGRQDTEAAMVALLHMSMEQEERELEFMQHCRRQKDPDQNERHTASHV
jgi:hypothetical protein